MSASSIKGMDALKLPLFLKLSPHILIWWIGSYTLILLEETNCVDGEFMLNGLVRAAIQSVFNTPIQQKKMHKSSINLKMH